MAIREGDEVVDPREPSGGRRGTVIGVHTNPACLMRSLEIKWHNDYTIEELEEIEFGPLED